MKIANAFNSPQKWAYWMLGVVIALSIYFVILDRFAPSTDDATTQAYVINVSSYVSGEITHVYVKNNQAVKAGQKLFQVNPTLYRNALEKAQANLIIMQFKVQQMRDNVTELNDALKASIAKLAYSKTRFDELQKLYKQKAISRDAFEKIRDGFLEAKERVFESEQSLLQAKQQLGPDINGKNIHIIEAHTAINTAKFNLDHTTARAAVNGFITNLQIRKGSFVNVGKNILTLIDNEQWWIQANFKENNLSLIKPGQTVDITVTSSPGQIFKGKVESIGWGVQTLSNGENANLPSIPKTNNWVNLAQRFPVRININHLKGKIPLRIGTTSIVTVYASDNILIDALANMNQWIRSKFQYLY